MNTYDPFATQYNDMVRAGGPEGAYRYIVRQVRTLLSPDPKSEPERISVCDIGCGQGELACRLSSLGAAVTGVDLSEKLLDYARQRSEPVTWLHDDARTLSRLEDGRFDCAVSSVMLMDVPDHRPVFASAHRILKPGAPMVWVIMHPCFQSPFSHPMGDGSRRIVRYDEQFWKSEGTGTIRSTLGAYHRQLSQYLNDFMAAGFSLLRVDELERDKPSVDALPSMFAAVGLKR